MTAKLPSGLVVLVLILSASVLMGQTRTSRRSSPSRRPQPSTEGTLQPLPYPSSDPPETEPGKVVAPVQGYVPPPEQAAPGTPPVFLVPSDPLDLAYWELYDRDRRVTVTGKVTRIDWSNPNTYIYLRTNDGAWIIESGFIQFRQSNVTPAVRVDQTISVLGYLPKEESNGELPSQRSPVIAAYLKTNHLIRAGEIVTAYGQKLVMGRPPSEYEMAQRLKCSALGC